MGTRFMEINMQKEKKLNNGLKREGVFFTHKNCLVGFRIGYLNLKQELVKKNLTNVYKCLF